MGRFKQLDPAKFNLDKYDNDRSIDYVLELDVGYPKELHEQHSDFPFAPDKLEIKKVMLSDYELKIAEDYNICIGNVKKLVPNFVGKENFVETFFITWIKNKKSTSCIRILSIKD